MPYAPPEAWLAVSLATRVPLAVDRAEPARNTECGKTPNATSEAKWHIPAGVAEQAGLRGALRAVEAERATARAERLGLARDSAEAAAQSERSSEVNRQTGSGDPSAPGRAICGGRRAERAEGAGGARAVAAAQRENEEGLSIKLGERQ